MMDFYTKKYAPNSKYNNFSKTYNPNQNNKSFTHPESEFLSKALSERESLIISNNIIPNEDWQSISNHIVKAQTIQNIEMSGINITGFGLRTLADAIHRANSVKSLKLEWNYFNEYSDDFDYFCDVLGSVRSLIYVI